MGARSRAWGNGAACQNPPRSREHAELGRCTPLFLGSEVPAGWLGRGRRQAAVLENPAAAAICCQKPFGVCQRLDHQGAAPTPRGFLSPCFLQGSRQGSGSFPPRFLLPHRWLRSVPRSKAALASHPTPPGHGTAPVPPGLPRSGSHARSQHCGIAPAPQEPRGGQEAARLRTHRGCSRQAGEGCTGLCSAPQAQHLPSQPAPPPPRAAGTAAAGPTK